MAKKTDNPGVESGQDVQVPVNETEVETTAEVEQQPGQEAQAPVDEIPEETEVEDEPKVKIVVLKQFRDRFDHKTLYHPGDELIFDAERAEDVIERELAKRKE